MHLHYADIDWEEFYAKHIPRSCLPSDYGGDLESVEALTKKNYDDLQTMEDYFALDEEETYALESDTESGEEWKAPRLSEKLF